MGSSSSGGIIFLYVYLHHCLVRLSNVCKSNRTGRFVTSRHYFASLSSQRCTWKLFVLSAARWSLRSWFFLHRGIFGEVLAGIKGKSPAPVRQLFLVQFTQLDSTAIIWQSRGHTTNMQIYTLNINNKNNFNHKLSSIKMINNYHYPLKYIFLLW